MESALTLIQLVYRHSTEILRNKYFKYNITGLKTQLAGGSQFAIHKRGGEFELGTTENKSSETPERDSIPRPPDCEFDVLTTRPHCLLNQDESIQTDVIYLDFAKAFDSVDHKILLTKLCAHGIPGKLLSWLVNYLSDRVQRVVLEGASSHWAPVTSGMPQGSLLGLLMFVTFINNLPDCAKGQVNTALYADDSKIFCC